MKEKYLGPYLKEFNTVMHAIRSGYLGIGAAG